MMTGHAVVQYISEPLPHLQHSLEPYPHWYNDTQLQPVVSADAAAARFGVAATPAVAPSAQTRNADIVNLRLPCGRAVDNDMLAPAI